MNASVEHFRRIGLSYRKLDHWTRRGYLICVGKASPGSGAPRSWPAGELLVAAYMLLLVEAGLTVSAAARAARARGQLADGITVAVSCTTWSVVGEVYNELVSGQPAELEGAPA